MSLAPADVRRLAHLARIEIDEAEAEDVRRKLEAILTLINELRAALRPDIEVVEIDTDVNDPVLARAMAERLDELHRSWAVAREGLRPGEEHDELGSSVAAMAAQ